MLIESINCGEIEIVELSPEYDLKHFDCEDTDLNEFLKEDAQKYKNQLIAKTYLALYNQEVIAFFSIMNDSIKLDPLETENTQKLQRLHEYPALKIGRLAVDKRFKKKGIGTFIFKYILGLTQIINDYASCRFLTVDSYHESIPFYEKIGFLRNIRYEKKKEYVSMRFDLLNSN